MRMMRKFFFGESAALRRFHSPLGLSVNTWPGGKTTPPGMPEGGAAGMLAVSYPGAGAGAGANALAELDYPCDDGGAATVPYVTTYCPFWAS